MRSGMTVSGFDDLIKSLGAAKDKIDDLVIETVADAGLTTQKYAVTGIQRGPATGKTYKRRGVTHRASAAGQFPASDTGRLASSVDVEGIGTKTVRVGTNLKYGAYLELSTANMQARPWLFPSAERAKKQVIKDAKKRYKEAFK